MIGITRGGGGGGYDYEDLKNIRQSFFEPTGLAGGTRDGYETAFRKVFAHCVANNRIDKLLPMGLGDITKIFKKMAIAGESVPSIR